MVDTDWGEFTVKMLQTPKHLLLKNVPPEMETVEQIAINTINDDTLNDYDCTEIVNEATRDQASFEIPLQSWDHIYSASQKNEKENNIPVNKDIGKMGGE